MCFFSSVSAFHVDSNVRDHYEFLRDLKQPVQFTCGTGNNVLQSFARARGQPIFQRIYRFNRLSRLNAKEDTHVRLLSRPFIFSHIKRKEPKKLFDTSNGSVYSHSTYIRFPLHRITKSHAHQCLNRVRAPASCTRTKVTLMPREISKVAPRSRSPLYRVQSLRSRLRVTLCVATAQCAVLVVMVVSRITDKNVKSRRNLIDKSETRKLRLCLP